MPAWLTTILVAALLVGGFYAGYRYLLPAMRGQAATQPSGFETPSLPQSTAATPHPLARHIELTGFRFSEDAKKRTQVKALLVNHSGADIADLKRHNEAIRNGELTGAELREMVHIAQSCSRRIQHMNIPVIAAVHGYAVGAGCEVAICCDLVVADETAKFGFPEVTVGACITTQVCTFATRFAPSASSRLTSASMSSASMSRCTRLS